MLNLEKISAVTRSIDDRSVTFMLEAVVLLLFCGALMICVVLDVSILYALVLGLALFMGYGRKKGHDWGTLTRMALSGVKTIKGIIIVF